MEYYAAPGNSRLYMRDYVASQYITATYDHYEDYLGRSIIIEPNRIIESFGSYMKQEDAVFRYRTVEVETVNGGTYGSRLGRSGTGNMRNRKLRWLSFQGNGIRCHLW